MVDKFHEYTSRIHQIAKENNIQLMMTMSIIEEWEVKSSMSIVNMDANEAMQTLLMLNSTVYNHLFTK